MTLSVGLCGCISEKAGLGSLNVRNLSPLHATLDDLYDGILNQLAELKKVVIPRASDLLLLVR
jgi:hypothetical protein